MILYLIFMNIEKKSRHDDKTADIVVVKQEGDRDARRILDGPMHLFRIEKCVDQSIFSMGTVSTIFA